MKQKTAIRQLIEDVKNDREFSLPMQNYLIKQISKYEPVNEQQIKDAYNDGYRAGDFEDADIYFNETFEKP